MQHAINVLAMTTIQKYINNIVLSRFSSRAPLNKDFFIHIRSTIKELP